MFRSARGTDAPQQVPEASDWNHPAHVHTDLQVPNDEGPALTRYLETQRDPLGLHRPAAVRMGAEAYSAPDGNHNKYRVGMEGVTGTTGCLGAKAAIL